MTTSLLELILKQKLYFQALLIPEEIKYLARMVRDIKFDYHTYFKGTGKKFVMNYYNF